MLYMESTSTDAGSLQITISFEMGTDPDQAAINVNNRVQAATARLPQQVRDQGVRVEARSNNILMVPVLFSPDGSRDVLFMSNYGLLNVLDELVRIPGVGDASLFGAQIGRASCRERVEVSVGAGSIRKKREKCEE